MWRVRPSTSLTFGRVAWKSMNSSGSMRAKRVAPSAEPRNWSAADAASPASFQPVNAHTRAGARSPSGRCSQMRGCIRTTVHHGFVPPAELRAVAAPPVAIATMRPGDEVRGIFACTRKDRLTARTGTPYLALALRDRSGTIGARVFRDADLQAGRFEKGDLVRVAGRVERFRDELQLELRAIARADGADPAAFLPVAYRDLDELDGFLEHLAGEVRDPAFRALLDGLLGDAGLRAAMRRSPCTRNGSPRLPRRAARAHGRRRHARARDVHPACAPGPGPAADRGARPRPRQDARVRA